MKVNEIKFNIGENSNFVFILRNFEVDLLEILYHNSKWGGGYRHLKLISYL